MASTLTLAATMSFPRRINVVQVFAPAMMVPVHGIANGVPILGWTAAQSSKRPSIVIDRESTAGAVLAPL